MAISSELASMDFESLVGGPLVAAVNAQSQASIAAAQFILNTAFEDPSGADPAKLKTVEMKVSKTLTDGSTTDVIINVPLLTMLQVPNLRIEEYNYVLACERADSVGCDMIHASLGYAEFDDKTKSHKYEDLNGNTSVASIGADIAASKGILLTVSAGNSGNSKWRYITPPADADSVLTIGAVNVKRKATKFSSEGPTPDGRVKPEVCAMGLYTYLQLVNGKMGMKSGTSFSSPLIAGATACLWQANPDKTNMQIIDAIIRSADKIKKPDVKYGYGIPDFYKAHIYLKKKK